MPRPAARQGRDVSRRLAGPRCVGGLRPPPEHHGQRAEGSGETFRRRGVDGRERKGCSRPLLADLGPRRCSSRVEQCVLGRATPAIAGLWRCGLLPRSLACCGFEPAAVWESNFTRPTPSTRRRPRDRVCSMQPNSLVDFHTGYGVALRVESRRCSASTRRGSGGSGGRRPCLCGNQAVS